MSSDRVIPTAFAYAIQQFGVVEAIDLPIRQHFLPCFFETGHSYRVPSGRSWDYNTYYKAVEFVKGLGMGFSAADVKKKKGNAWWLLRPHFSEGIFDLHCTLSETNFTNEMAIMHTLFVSEDPGNPVNVIANLSVFREDSYGTMMWNPRPQINLNCFEGIREVVVENCAHLVHVRKPSFETLRMLA